jgi:hypothetical protein
LQFKFIKFPQILENQLQYEHQEVAKFGLRTTQIHPCTVLLVQTTVVARLLYSEQAMMIVVKANLFLRAIVNILNNISNKLLVIIEQVLYSISSRRVK